MWSTFSYGQGHYSSGVDCLHIHYDHCVGDGTLYRHKGEWRMHACLQEPMWVDLPKQWEVCGMEPPAGLRRAEGLQLV